MNKSFRLLSLTANSATFANPDLLSHTLRQTASAKAKRVGATDTFLVRSEMKEIIPHAFTDGSGNTRVNQTVTVSFSGYSDEPCTKALLQAWERIKLNVDAALADRMLQGFTTDGKTSFVSAIVA